MSHSSTLTSPEIWANIDDRLKSGDEDRWLSSRYAPAPERKALIALYAFAYELAKVRLVVSEPALGAIRFQWWRDALDELENGEPPRAHEVVGAVADMIADGHYKPVSLARLVDLFEDAFENGDRAQQPEAHLTGMAADILSTEHGWQSQIDDLAPHVAALRRGDQRETTSPVGKAPSAIRPAVAHFRLRRLYQRDERPGKLAKRFCVLRAVMTGRL